MRSEVVREYLQTLGIDRDLIEVYIVLCARGPQTISELSRNAGVDRVQLYRMMNRLQATSLVEIESRYKRYIIRPASIDNIRMLLRKKEQELSQLKDALPVIEQALASPCTMSSQTRVHIFKGAEGIRQMLWNQLKASGEIVGYNYSIFEDIAGNNFMNNWVREFETRRLRCRLVFGDEFETTWQANVEKYYGEESTKQRVRGMDYFHLSPEVFKITHSCDVYDGVVAYYHWEGGDIFGAEIHNPRIADSQRQLFELLQKQSRPETQF